MASVTLTMGSPSFSSSTNIAFYANPVYGEIPAEIMAGNSVGYLATVTFFSQSASISVSASQSFDTTSGQDLNESWEQYDQAITLTASHGSVTIGGPDSSDAANSDTTETYSWNMTPAARSRMSSWLSGYTSGDSVSITLDDGVVTVPVFPSDSGTPVVWSQNEAITAIVVPEAENAATYVVHGSLPDGITFSAPTRTLSGTPTGTGTGTITIRATNDEGTADWTLDYTINRPPSADAGSDQTVDGRASVTLDGSGSSDPDGNTYTYEWTQTSGTSVTLSDSSVVGPTFTAPNPASQADLVFQLEVTDEHGLTDTDSVTVTIRANQAPTADAGTNRSVGFGSTVQLSGSGSDPEGAPITYSWEQIQGTSVTLSDSSVASPTFTAPTSSSQIVLRFRLTVGDGITNASDTVDITVSANQSPVADAGPNQTVSSGALVTLDGSGSSDPESSTLTYTWSQSLGTTVTLSDTGSASPTFSAPFLDSAEVLRFSLIVNDGVSDSSPDLVDITVNANRRPVSDAGDDANVGAGSLIQLDGSGSSDPDGNPLTYEWTQPQGPAVTLSDSTIVNPTFTAPAVTSSTRLRFRLRVSDGHLSDGDVIDLFVQPSGDTLSANAGADQTVASAASVTLDGSGSTGPAGFTYSWTQVGGSSVVISNDKFAQASFTAPHVSADTDFTFRLTTASGIESSTDDVVVTVQANQSPVANAGTDVNVASGGSFVLDGSGSSDPEGQSLTYSWTLGSTVVGTTEQVSLTAPTTGATLTRAYVLVVTDPGGLTDVDTVTVTVTGVNRAPAAEAGPAQTVNYGDTVTLDGSGSSDPDGNTLTYSWEEVTAHGISLTGPTTVGPTFVAPSFSTDTRVTFRLTVSDSLLTSTDTVEITVSANSAPIANAGSDQTVDSGASVMLDGSGSSDADGNPLTYSWSEVTNSGVTIVNPTNAQASFTAIGRSVEVVLTFRLTVSDGARSSTDDVNVRIRANQSPTASATGPATVAPGASATLNAAGSTDPEGDALTYSWTQVSGLSITLTNADTATPSFTAPNITGTSQTVVFQVEVSDGTSSDTAQVSVIITARTATPIDQNQVALVVEWYDKDRALISESEGTISQTGDITLDWQRFDSLFEAPINAVEARFKFVGEKTTGTTDNSVYMTRPYIRHQVGSDLLVPGSVSTEKIAPLAITNPKIAVDAVDTSQIVANSITNAKIGTSAVDTAQIVNAAIDNTKLGTDAVDTANIVADAITQAKIAVDAVGTDQIVADSITNVEIAVDAVDTDQIVADAITQVKVATDAIGTDQVLADAITNAKVAVDAIGTDQILADAITNAKVAVDAIGTNEILADAITAIKIANDAVETAKIKADAITQDLIANGAVGTDQVLADAITTAKIAVDAIGTDQIVADAVTNVHIAVDAVDSDQILADAITAVKIAADAVESAKIKADAVTNTHLAIDSVGTDQIVNDAISAVKIAADAVESAKIKADAVTSAHLAADSVGTDQIADDAVTGDQLAADSVGTDQIADDAVTNDQLAVDSVNTDQIVNDAISAVKIATDAVESAKIKADAVTAIKIATDAVETAKIKADAITAVKIATDAVESAKIKADAITSVHLATDSVESDAIKADAVTTAKIAPGAVTGDEIMAGSIGSTQLAPGTELPVAITENSITAREIAANTITAAEIAADTITASELAANTITAAEIAADAITASELAAGSVGTSELVAGSVTTNEIAANTIVASDIAAGTVTTAEIAAGTILAANISAGTITTAEIAATTILAANIAADTITASQIAGDTITASELAANSVTASEIAAGTVTASEIAAGTITANELAANSVTASEIAANAVRASEIQANAVSTSELNANAVTSAKIASNTIVAGDIAANTITASEILAGTITTSEIAADTIVAADIAAGAVTTSEIAADAVTASEILAGTITTSEIAAGTIVTGDIASDTITAGNIAAGTITSTEILAGTITSANIAANTIVAGDIAANAVTASEIATDAVRSAEIQANAVSTSELNANAVTSAKIAANTIVAGDIAANTITAAEIAAGTITADEIAAGVITAFMIEANSITATEIAANTITASEIAAGTITTAEIAAGTITAANIAAGTITANEIAAGVITAPEIVAGSITTTEIAANTILAEDIAANTITASEIAADTITATEIAANTVTAAEILAGTITATEILAGTITTNEIAADTITASNIAAGTVTTAEILAGTIVAGDIAAGTITANELAANSVTASEIAADAVRASEIQANAVSTSELNANAVTSAKIAANTIVANDIAADTITASEILAATITGAEIAANTITGSNLVAGTITASEIGAGVITANEIAAGTITANEIATGVLEARTIEANSITANEIAANTITAAEIAAGTITADEIAANTITAGQIAANTITASQIAAGTITAGQIAAGTITASEILAATITGNEIAANTIAAANIVAATITGNEIAANTITGGNLVAGTITAGQIAAGAIGTTELAVGGVDGTIIADGAISTDHIVADAITADKINFGSTGFFANASITAGPNGLSVNLGEDSVIGITSEGLDITGTISADHIDADVRNAVVLWEGFLNTDADHGNSITMTQPVNDFSTLTFIAGENSTDRNQATNAFASCSIPVNDLNNGVSTANKTSVGRRINFSFGPNDTDNETQRVWKSSDGLTVFISAEEMDDNCGLLEVIGFKNPDGTSVEQMTGLFASDSTIRASASTLPYYATFQYSDTEQFVSTINTFEQTLYDFSRNTIHFVGWHPPAVGTIYIRGRFTTESGGGGVQGPWSEIITHVINPPEQMTGFTVTNTSINADSSSAPYYATIQYDDNAEFSSPMELYDTTESQIHGVTWVAPAGTSYIRGRFTTMSLDGGYRGAWSATYTYERPADPVPEDIPRMEGVRYNPNTNQIRADATTGTYFCTFQYQYPGDGSWSDDREVYDTTESTFHAANFSPSFTSTNNYVVIRGRFTTESNDGGDAGPWSTWYIYTTNPYPGPVPNLTLFRDDPFSIRVTWDASAGASAYSYRYRYRTCTYDSASDTYTCPDTYTNTWNNYQSTTATSLSLSFNDSELIELEIQIWSYGNINADTNNQGFGGVATGFIGHP